LVKKDSDYKKPQNPKSFGAFLKKRAPIYLGLIGLFLLFAYPALTEKDLNSILNDSYEGSERTAVDLVKFYSGPNDSGITILEVIEEKINDKYSNQKIFDDEETWAKFVVENLENRNEEFTHEVVFVFNAENNQSMMYGWYVNVENGEISPTDTTSKNIQQAVDYFD
jgi:hypothetical protein|tara:strand:+ start:1875 stop:2375 length:501 start_codon:yes stop_codon:yes gene_type:complete